MKLKNCLSGVQLYTKVDVFSEKKVCHNSNYIMLTKYEKGLI